MTEDWVPVDACTLPTAEQPFRVAEFDQLFAERLLRVERRGPDEILLLLRDGTGVAERVADLVTRESLCCSFFAFDLEAVEGELALSVAVPAAYVDVLTGLASRATQQSGRGAQGALERSAAHTTRG